MPNAIQKRRFNRQNVQQPAMLIGRIFGAIKGEIRDFSANGVLFTLGNSPMAGNLQDQPVAVSFKSTAEQYRITGRIVRVFDRSIGIAIDQFSDPAYRALALLAEQSAPPIRYDAIAVGKPETVAANSGCLALYRKFIDQVITHFYGNLGNKLTALEIRQTSTAQRWALRHAEPLLVARRKEIESALLDEPDVRQIGMPQEEQGKRPLELVDTKEFDDWLAVSQLIHKLNIDYVAEISQFESKQAALPSSAKADALRSYSPQRIFWTVHEVLGRLVQDNELKAHIYQLFYESVREYFEPFYAQLNNAVAFVSLPQAAVGKPKIRPKLTPEPERLPASPPSTDLTAFTSPQAIPASNSLNIQGRSRSLSISDYFADAKRISAATNSLSTAAAIPEIDPVSFDYGLNQLLWRFNYFLNNQQAGANSQALNDAIIGRSELQPAANSAVVSAVYELPGRAYPRMQFIVPSVPRVASDTIHPIALEQYLAPILKVINQIEQRPSAQMEEGDAIPVKARLRDALAQLKAPEGLDPLIETIGSFEEGLVDQSSGKSSNSAIIGLLKKIEMPLIKLALTDEDFVQGKNHPALQTVNLIERFHAATDDAGLFFDPRLQRLLDMLITQIVDRFESNNKAVFDEINKVLVTLLMPIEEARKNKIAQIQLTFSQRENNAAENHKVDHDPDRYNDDTVIKVMELMSQGDWVAVTMDDDPVAFQLVCHSTASGRYLFVNRSVTTVVEYTKAELYEVLAQHGMQVLPEYDLPFMERSAYKCLLTFYAQICQQAMHDPVSGLINRKALMVHLEAIFGQEPALRKGIFVCVMMLDRNNLLCQNIDSAEAESSFASFIEAISRYLQPEDVFARLSDTTFTIVLHNSDTERAVNSMKTFITRLEAQRIRFQDKYFAIGGNIGISELTDFIDTPQNLLKTAGAACISAKQQGVNWVELYQPHNKQIEQEQSMFEWAGAIDQMLGDRLLYLRCQKIQPVDGSGNFLPHYEILLGLPDNVDITIQRFVLAAEKWNRSADIDMWVLQQSFVWLRAQKTKLGSIGGVSINLSGQSLNNQKIWAIIKENLQTEPELAQKIIFEITETAVIQNLETAQRFIETTRGYGCRFSLDDFGSGYNSFAYLRTLSLDFLKIDGAFVRDMVKSSTDFAMVKCMHDIAHALGLKTVAEYVENDDILGKLLELGVDYAQGYAVETSKPISELIL